MQIGFQTSPPQYRHWCLDFNGETARLIMDVDEAGGLSEGYELKLNSYDLGVDIELYDALQRLRFEHPEVKTVVLSSAKERVFCAGANIRMLAGSSHAHKVNFCKFTNETRNSIEQASQHSGLKFIAAVTGSCAGGGYELALACDFILLTDDGSSSVSLPEVPLLAVLPGTGGLTRVTDKRKVRRDRADMFCCIEEGIKGQKAVDWRLVDAVAVNSQFEQKLSEVAAAYAAQSDRPNSATGIKLNPIQRNLFEYSIDYSCVAVEINRELRVATITISAPQNEAPASIAELISQGDQCWNLRAARELDDAILHLRLNESEIGIIQFKTSGHANNLMHHDAFLLEHQNHWLAREILLNWARVLQRIDLTSRSLVALIEPGSCFVGTLAEVAFACDRIFMADGEFEELPGDEARLILSAVSFGHYPMPNGLTRLQARLPGEADLLEAVTARQGKALLASEADELGLISNAYDDIDWYDEIRIFLEERASFSADALTAMEANLRFGGSETMESKIFGRLTAWQNWVFQRPNAVGEAGALGRYGSGKKAAFDRQRV
ncbi:MAG: benzoyl-CoA-dihydrodiol lyase [Gammaproteobacteria bacterium]|nr:benzoyl-CoA-dihydrodiol lyase [Gammaproteobacteria bacterium]